MKKTDYIRNPQLHSPRYLSNTPGCEYVTTEGYFVDSEFHRYEKIITRETDAANTKEVKKALEHYGFYLGQAFPTGAGVGEWGFTFTCLKAGNRMGDGRTLLDSVQYGAEKPETRRDAIRIIKNWMFEQFKEEIVDSNGHWNSMNGHYLWNHYAGEFGAEMIGSEVGESIVHEQASMAFTRGAGRQYGVPIFIDFSEWYGRVNQAHSPSLIERTGVATYLGGMSFYIAEAGCYNALVKGPAAGEYKLLTEPGKVYKKLIDFAAEYPDIGVNYTPFGIVMDYCHGIRANAEFRKAFGYFDYTPGDNMTWALIDSFFPKAWTRDWNETTYQVNGPYGDTCDTLLQNASQEVLNSYPCLILTGDIVFTPEEAARYVAYVKQGGTLLLNTAYLPQFADYESRYTGGTQSLADGAGQVIVYGPDYDITALDGIIKDQLKKLVPFTISQQVEYLVNVKDGAMLVTLINNEGYSKTIEGDPVVDDSKALEVTVTYTGADKVKSITEVYEKAPVTVRDNAVTVKVEPGCCKVLEFCLD